MFMKIKLFIKINKVINNIKKIFENQSGKIEETKSAIETIKRGFEQLINIFPEDRELINSIVDEIKSIKK